MKFNSKRSYTNSFSFLLILFTIVDISGIYMVSIENRRFTIIIKFQISTIDYESRGKEKPSITTT